MEYKNIIIKPKTFSELLLSYFIVFIKNLNLLFVFNIIVLGLFFLIGFYDDQNLSASSINQLLIKAIIYSCFFSLPASFISSFFLTLIKNLEPNFKNILHTFSANSIRIFLSNFLLCAAIFSFNLIVKSQILMFQYNGPIEFLITEMLYCILIFSINPLHPSIKTIFTKKIFKYLITIFILLIITTLFYRLSFNLLIQVIDTLTELIGIQQPDSVYNYGLIIIEYINKIAIFTILIYNYYNFVSEANSTYHLEEINQIKLNKDEEDCF